MTAPTLRVGAVQAASALDPAANRAALPALVARAVDAGAADLVVLPEAFARDFGEAGSDVSAFAETLAPEGADGPFATAVDDAARRHGVSVVAGMFERGDDLERPFNTLVVRGEEPAAYRKVHLYDSFGYRESDRLSPGPLTPTVVDVAGWRVGLMTCYDLRFPEHARALVDLGAEVLVLPSAWVAGPRKVHHWRTLLTARAIENTVFVVAAAQSAPRYSGHSMILDPAGEVLAEAGPGSPAEPEIVVAELRREVLDDVRAANPSLTNRRLPATSHLGPA